MMKIPVLCVVLCAFICHSHSLEIQTPVYRFKRSQEKLMSDPSECVSRTHQVFPNSNNISVDIRMPGVVPTGSDTYLCTAFRVPTSRDAYIVDFIPHASMDTVHHMILFGCQTPASKSSYWDCGSVQGTCQGESAIMYAWARNAPPTKLPKDVGFKVGGKSGMSYFVLQIHYGDVSAFKDHHRDCSGLTLRMTSKPQPFIAGIYLLMSEDTVIPPGKRVTNADIACDYSSYPIYPFAFRTHTHHLGKVVSGYRIRDGKWTLIGRQSPQLPQAFYPVNKEVNVKYGDTIAARCVFTGEGQTSKTYIGGTSGDEMCNFYIMYYMDSRHAIPFMNCMDTGVKELFQHIPDEANVPINVSPDRMMHMGHLTGHQDNRLDSNQAEQVLDQGDLYSLMSKLLGQNKDVVHSHNFSPSEMQRTQAELVAQIDSLMQKKDPLAFQTREDPVLVRDRVHKFHQLEATAKSPRSKLLAEEQDYHLEQVTAWPQSSLQLGQVSGLALDSDSNLVIFHRGDHHWGADSFNSRARYQQRSLGPIQQSTILVVDPARGNILKASGRNMFYLPHGITTDKENNYWVTDVALHQVFKMSSDDKILLALGEAFTPGSDSTHFCQPTDVAVDTETGNIFVSDGYCNARILNYFCLIFLPEGSSDRRRRVPFRIPHSLVFLPDKQEVCVADRENGRIQCFIAETGEFVKEIKKEEFGGKVFAITYSPVGELHRSVKKAGIEVQEFGEMETIVQTKVSKTAANPQKQTVAKDPQPQKEAVVEMEKEKTTAKPNAGQGVLPAIITTLLLIPLLLVISIGVFIFWRKNNRCEVKSDPSSVGGILGKIRGKAVGSLNLGNFFASHKGYSRQGFDQLSTEGSDQERNDEDSSDSENEEYSALPPPQSSS
ncbi:hypothetical protein L3Q82_012256 [Scortum barcoo]|uniref:Uncharacterized protein n=1 Tax=Scortum barcoo TaxID=214431 RepID=A0ACB8W4I4_9TELE|nr:hypothetical protein L3Q82_012256 [Scortum barcoo]